MTGGMIFYRQKAEYLAKLKFENIQSIDEKLVKHDPWICLLGL